MARRETAEVIGLDSIAMRFQKMVAAVVRHADVSLMSVSVPNHKGLGPGVNSCDGHGFGVVLLSTGCTVDASHYCDAPVRGMPNTIQIDHFDFSVFCLTDDIRQIGNLCASSTGDRPFIEVCWRCAGFGQICPKYLLSDRDGSSA